MNTTTKGAFAMILAGSVTFSATNALLIEPFKQLTKEHSFTRSGDHQKADEVFQAEETSKNRKQTTNVKDSQTEHSHEVPAKSGMAAAATQRSSDTAAIRASAEKPTPLPAEATKPVAVTKAPTTTAVASPTGTNTRSSSPVPAVITKPATSTKAGTTTAPSSPARTSTTSPPAKPAAAMKPAAGEKTSKPAARPTGSDKTSVATAKTNRGQQVSQTVKENASSQRDQKENNGNKM